MQESGQLQRKPKNKVKVPLGGWLAGGQQVVPTPTPPGMGVAMRQRAAQGLAPSDLEPAGPAYGPMDLLQTQQSRMRPIHQLGTGNVGIQRAPGYVQNPGESLPAAIDREIGQNYDPLRGQRLAQPDVSMPPRQPVALGPTAGERLFEASRTPNLPVSGPMGQVVGGSRVPGSYGTMHEYAAANAKAIAAAQAGQTPQAIGAWHSSPGEGSGIKDQAKYDAHWDYINSGKP